MSTEFFLQIANNAALGTVLLILGVAFWIYIFNRLEVRKPVSTGKHSRKI